MPEIRFRHLIWLALLLAISGAQPTPASAQAPAAQPSPASLTLDSGAAIRPRPLPGGAERRSNRSTPRPLRSQAARSAYLPRLDAVWQTNRGDGEQRLRPAASAVGDTGHLGTGPPHRHRQRASGESRPVRCSRGSRSISACVTRPSCRSRGRRWRGRDAGGGHAPRRAGRGRRLRSSPSLARAGAVAARGRRAAS